MKGSRQEAFHKTVIRIALPVTMQSLLQSSFGVVDQLMIGKLGSSNIAGVGLGGKFSSLYSVLLAAVAAAAGIMISQYIGQKDEKEVSRSFFANLALASGLAVFFMVLCIFFPEDIMRFYTKDGETRRIAGNYLRIVAVSYLPMAVSGIAATLLRSTEAAMLPLYASLAGVLANTGFNYLLIFGKAGFPQMGAEGAAAATVISQAGVCGLTIWFLFWHSRKCGLRLVFLWRFDGEKRKQFLGILCPIIICEFFWSLGENVYAAIYGNIGTDACAAMTLTIPIQTLFIGALSGLAQAAGIIVGKALGGREYERAYRESKKLMWYGLTGSLLLSAGLLAAGGYYVGIYEAGTAVRETACQILWAFALIAPVKVQNMILGGGIIRSGGKTKYVMGIDLIGTWLFGVPLGLLGAFVWKLPIAYAYFLLSMEECVRLGISLVLFRKKSWMRSLGSGEGDIST